MRKERKGERNGLFDNCKIMSMLRAYYGAKEGDHILDRAAGPIKGFLEDP